MRPPAVPLAVRRMEPYSCTEWMRMGPRDGGVSERRRLDGMWILVECVLVSLLATVLLMVAVHGVWREKRQSFVNSFVLLNKTISEEKVALRSQRARVHVPAEAPSLPRQETPALRRKPAPLAAR